MPIDFSVHMYLNYTIHVDTPFRSDYVFWALGHSHIKSSSNLRPLLVSFTFILFHFWYLNPLNVLGLGSILAFEFYLFCFESFWFWVLLSLAHFFLFSQPQSILYLFGPFVFWFLDPIFLFWLLGSALSLILANANPNSA